MTAEHRSHWTRGLFWVLVLFCSFVEIELGALIWQGPFVDTKEHRRAVYNLHTSTNHVEALKAYQTSMAHRRQQIRNVRTVLFSIAIVNGAALLFFVSRLGTGTEQSICTGAGPDISGRP